MKIVMVHTMYAPNLFGGAEKLVMLLAEGLIAAGHDVAVIAASPDDAGVRDHRGVRVHEVGNANLYWPYGEAGAPKLLEPIWHALDLRNPVMARRVRDVLASEDPDLVHTHGLVAFSTLVWREVARAGKPLVHTMHDHRLHCVRAGMFKGGRACEGHCLSCRLVTPLKRTFADVVDVAIGVSRSVLDEHVAAGFFRSAEREVIGVPVAMDDRALPAESPEGPLRLGFLGRLHPGKGVELLLEATGALPAEGWSLRIAGTGETAYVKELHARPRHANVTFAGHVDAPAFLRSIDVLVVPSQWLEPAGLVVVEAHAHGVPVIASRRGGLTELVPDGTGSLFDPTSAGELTDLLRAAVADPSAWRGRGDACCSAARAHTVEAMIGAYLRVYGLAADKRRTA